MLNAYFYLLKTCQVQQLYYLFNNSLATKKSVDDFDSQADVCKSCQNNVINNCMHNVMSILDGN